MKLQLKTTTRTKTLGINSTRWISDFSRGSGFSRPKKVCGCIEYYVINKPYQSLNKDTPTSSFKFSVFRGDHPCGAHLHGDRRGDHRDDRRDHRDRHGHHGDHRDDRRYLWQ